MKGEKYCPKCGKTKLVKEFSLNRARHDNLAGYCKECFRTKINTPKRNAKQELKRRYNMSLEVYNDMLETQNFKCKICGRKICGRSNGVKSKTAQVDHNHETGQIRGLLCSYCNPGLGLFMDSVSLLKKAIKYLEYHKGSTN